ncbi:Alpha/Beta hydrolase protein [Aspergillus falconensis]
MESPFNNTPHNIPGNPEPFTLHIPKQEISELQHLLKLSKIGPATWWNQHGDAFPISRSQIKDPESGKVNIHFAALFSTKKDAIPIIFLHGYPGSFVEYLPMMDLLRDNENVEMSLDRAARIMNQLMIDLGFENGYIAQGGDLGSMPARIMSVRYKECKALHVNMLVLNPDQTPPASAPLTPAEEEHLERANTWLQTGVSYALEHGTRPSTIGLVVSSNPLALLAWIGEKYLEWTDPRRLIPLDTIPSMKFPGGQTSPNIDGEAIGIFAFPL